jgi:RimJ/RimL family protein N-acetyltransferase
MRLPKPTLTDGVVVLRASDARDVAGIETGLRDPDVVRWFGQSTLSAEDVLELNERRWTDGSPTLSVCERDGQFVGLVWVNVSSSDSSVGSIGYWLLPSARRHGLATRAVRLISCWAFRDLPISLLRIVAEVGNERSQALAVRSGFQRKGVLPANAVIDGRSVDHVLFELRAARR